MTEIHVLAAGPALDRIVAEEVMGWTVMEPAPGLDASGNCKIVVRMDAAPGLHVISDWTPSRDLRAAQIVLKHLMSEQWEVEIRIRAERGSPEDDPMYEVTIRLARRRATPWNTPRSSRSARRRSRTCARRASGEE